MLISKKYMNFVRSWCHCFNALSVSYANCQKTRDQFFIPF